MSDFITMIQRIETEIHRTNVRDEIKDAVRSSIAHYEDKQPFAWNSERWTSDTIVDQKFMPLPDNFVDFRGSHPLQITVNQSQYPLNKRGWDYLQWIDLDAVVGKGIPFDWAYGDEQIRLYPIPQDTYPLCLYGKKSLSALSADTDTNAWMTDGERIIRARSKWDLYENLIHQFDKAGRQKSIEIEAYDIEVGNEARRAISGHIQPWVL